MTSITFTPQTKTHQFIQPILPTLLRSAAFITIACSATFALFVLMQYLVKPSDIRPPEAVPYTVIDPVFSREESPVTERPTLSPPPKTVTPPKMQPEPAEPNDSTSDNTYAFNPAIPPTSIGQAALPLFAMTDAEAKPMVRVEPKYPLEAARNGIEGWVQLRFDITPTGTVDNIQVINSEPARVFDREAKRALSRWKYQPKIIDGVAKAQQNQNVMLSFTIGE